MNAVERLAARFGGQEDFCSALRESAGAVARWIRKGYVPHFRRWQIQCAAERYGVDVPAKVINAACVSPAARAKAA